MLKIAAVFMTMALSIASAKSYTISVLQPAVLAGTELKAGEYKLEVNGDKIALKNGKDLVESGVTVQSTDSKNRTTNLRLEDQGGKLHIKEIRLGGTNTKLLVN